MSRSSHRFGVMADALRRAGVTEAMQDSWVEAIDADIVVDGKVQEGSTCRVCGRELSWEDVRKTKQVRTCADCFDPDLDRPVDRRRRRR